MTRTLMTPILAVALAIGLTACSVRTQTTSGADYLARYEADASITKAKTGARVTGKARRIDPEIREAAAVEPVLRFPARIGLARIERGRLTAIPASETAIWQKMAERHAALGSFDVVDPLVAHATAEGLGYSSDSHDVGAMIRLIRLGAARQHLDAVLIYEVGARGGAESNGLAFMDLTIIGGAILPTRSIEVEGVAKALLMDVRNGYPYGSAATSVDLSSLSPSWGSDARAAELRREALGRVTASLAPKIEQMFSELVTRMAARK